MKTRWSRFYKAQLENRKLKRLVEQELAGLRVGAQIAHLRKRERLTQTKLAARAGMPSSKISAIENSPQNLELSTLVRIAHAANRKVKISFPARRRTHRLAPDR